MSVSNNVVMNALTRASIYQEYLAKTLTDKYSTLNVQMDKVINDANSELNILNQKLNSMTPALCAALQLTDRLDMQIDQDKLKAENTQLVAAFREKHRKYQQTQDLYDRLKRKEMTAATQSAAFESVDEVIGNVSSRPGAGASLYSQQNLNPRTQAQRDFQPVHVDHDPIEQIHMHQRNGSHGSGGMMPPPIRRAGGISNTFNHGRSHSIYCGAPGSLLCAANPMPTPSDHRTQLGPMAQSASRYGTGNPRTQAGMISRSPKGHTPAQRQPFGNLGTSSVNRPSMSGYGMSAGMKTSQQQGGELHFDAPQPSPGFATLTGCG